MTRTERYPLLPGVFATVYPNPKEEVGFDTWGTNPKPPPPASCSAADVAGIVAKLENASAGPAYEAGLTQLKRCVWLQTKGADENWAAMRAELGPRGTDFQSLGEKDMRVDGLVYGAAPNTVAKFGLKSAA
mmetsp:Transcript_3318/g.7800  ORF Transcript_3318/g.7800 Transcript_3318/m.7800 type:complete len:131 (+) Transcript_3318:194-586(+)|eukprot:CAMPEP_0178993536 /NCGR_PEP_ID=MMETSP0795-20121207/6755_1 /TAXON_ID=88552 /ORGANISM="Amoebophrya sp., Strain Ameob2" /LENGTH=130 /DNA_ID=CAMNT_0020685601 /DNA_START=196 /DNA_END=591 /DNA_ORIENTATION=-